MSDWFGLTAVWCAVGLCRDSLSHVSPAHSPVTPPLSVLLGEGGGEGGGSIHFMIVSGEKLDYNISSHTGTCASFYRANEQCTSLFKDVKYFSPTNMFFFLNFAFSDLPQDNDQFLLLFSKLCQHKQPMGCWISKMVTLVIFGNNMPVCQFSSDQNTTLYLLYGYGEPFSKLLPIYTHDAYRNILACIGVGFLSTWPLLWLLLPPEGNTCLFLC